MTRSSIAIIAGMSGAALSTILDLSDKIWKVSDRLGWTQSEAMTLARDTEKSRFSDNLIRSAWKRLFLADRFSRRVLDGAPSVEVLSAWNNYLQALLEWNTDLMVNIVGLEGYYDMHKSIVFEVEIQAKFAAVDQAIRQLYLAPYTQGVIYQTANVATGKPLQLGADVFKATDDARASLYVFVRCFSKGDRSQSRC
ncbi:hypothetical protein [Sinorhizobium meliloti]|uniref:hypothetical protein n=1 Tax=Rhizobium meliloti TaxID=382 RepID=UPI0020919220|nr:hypothetical protein [Sinorhizobium meliloti]MCO5963703.1 hypothetical protein [Sinorhizobium meliloti]